MHQQTTDLGIPRSANIKGGGNSMSSPENSQQPTPAEGSAQARCDETDLLALLKRLGLAFSPRSASGNGNGNSNGNINGSVNRTRNGNGIEDGNNNGDGSSNGNGGVSGNCDVQEVEALRVQPTPAPNNRSNPSSSNGSSWGGGDGGSESGVFRSFHGGTRQPQHQPQQASFPAAPNFGGSASESAENDQKKSCNINDRSNDHTTGGSGQRHHRSGREGGTVATTIPVSPPSDPASPVAVARIGHRERGNGSSFSSGGGACISGVEVGAALGDPVRNASKIGGGVGLGASAAAASEEGMVDLMRREITAREALLLGPILWAATGVTCLKLCYNHLKDGGAEAVSGAIERHPSLHTMDLGFNGIADQGAASLARSLVQNRSLRTLYLSGNSIGEPGAAALAGALARNSGLATLHLSGNCIGPDGASALAEALKSNASLTRLYIDGAGIKARGACAVASALVTNNVLSDLHMSDNEIGDEGVEGLAHALRRNQSVRLLELCFNRITGAGAEALAKAIWGCTNLHALRLDNNQVGDRGAQALASALPTLGLETLELGFNNVATAGVAALMQATVNSPSFTSLSLSGNVLDAEAAKAIQGALSQPRCALRRFSLDHTSLGRASEGFIANGVLSNRRLALASLTGFKLGAAFARLGMPSQVANFSNEQSLEQVRLYWANHLNIAGSGRAGSRATAAAAGRNGTGGGSGNTNAIGAGKSEMRTERQPSEAAGQQQQQQHGRVQPKADARAPSAGAGTAVVAKGVVGGEEGEQSQRSRQGKGPVPSSAMKSCRLVAGTGAAVQEQVPVHPVAPSGGGAGVGGTSGDGRGIVEDKPRRPLVQALHDIAKLPFSAAELWSLHQYYFSPPVEPRSPASAATAPPTSSVPYPSSTTSAAAAAAAAAGCGVGWLDGFCGTGNGRGREDSDIGSIGPGAVAGPRQEVSTAQDDAVGAGARRCRRSSSLGEEEDDEVDSPRPPSKRYRNSSTKTRIACFPLVQARIRSLKSKPDERGVLTLLRQLKFLEAGECSTPQAPSATGKVSDQPGAAPSGTLAGFVGGATGVGIDEPASVLKNALTDGEVERILLEEL